MPPVPVVVEKIEVQLVPSLDVWIWNAVAYAASQSRVTWQMLLLEPRSTCSHCGIKAIVVQRAKQSSMHWTAEGAADIIACAASTPAAGGLRAAI
jgi:hypothetical protein